MNQSSDAKWFQMDKDVHCQKCGVKFRNRNHKKKHMRTPCEEKVRFGLSYMCQVNCKKPSFCLARYK